MLGFLLLRYVIVQLPVHQDGLQQPWDEHVQQLPRRHDQQHVRHEPGGAKNSERDGDDLPASHGRHLRRVRGMRRLGCLRASMSLHRGRRGQGQWCEKQRLQQPPREKQAQEGHGDPVGVVEPAEMVHVVRLSERERDLHDREQQLEAYLNVRERRRFRQRPAVAAVPTIARQCAGHVSAARALADTPERLRQAASASLALASHGRRW
mmetsp:Transcript_9757/g.40211  ORF Transcript_9757/g.40211 Transcript_9757/m.40211 type:complete len:208 (-) Transcript_9757:316-939(-)